ncbi:MAG: spore germination protein, partial [Clostridia bacterium]
MKKDIVKYIKDATSNSQDIVYRKIEILGNKFDVIFNEAVADSSTVSDFVIRSIENSIINKSKENNNEVKIISKNHNINNLSNLLENELFVSKVKKIDILKDDLFYYIYSGFTLIVTDDSIIAVETKADLNRGIDEPKSEASIKGPKDCFIENYMKNIGLIRKRIKTEKLKIDENLVGRRSKSKVGVMYICDIAKPEIVKYIEEKIKKIYIYAILDSNAIREILISGGDTTVFPTVISTERPDNVCHYLLQGRVAVIVENSPFVLIFPAFISDFFKHVEDYYQKNNAVIFTRMLRYIAFAITLLMPAIYVALTTFNQEAIPTDLLVSFAVQRDGVPAPAFIEALVMILSFEILREGDFRVPSLAGSTLSIVGALILGEAAVSAGIVSPIMIIVVATTTISGLIFSDINMVNALRTWRIIFLIFASCAGLIGIVVA